MPSKSTIAILAVIVVVVVAAGIYAGTTQLNPGNQSDDNKTTNDNSQINTSQNNSSQNMITTQEAQDIALRYIEEPNATAGTPKLIDQDGQKIYVVPVMMNGTAVGQIDIDAYTGENVGGAGGAP